MTNCSCDTFTSNTSNTSLNVSNTSNGHACVITQNTGAAVDTMQVGNSGANSAIYAYNSGGGNGIAASANGYALWGWNTSTGTGIRGDSGTSNGVNAVGVLGTSASGKGILGEGGGSGVTGWGTANYAYGLAGDCNYSYGVGVYGSGTGTGGYGGYFVGPGYFSGYLSKSGGGYKIDHPSDPGNKYLNHCFVESPEMLNIYRGRAVFDANGDAIVTLPSYFNVAVESPEYILTPIGASMLLFVSEEITNNHFKISGGIAGKSVSWQVSAARADKWAKTNHPGVEIDKPIDKIGKFLHPELYGATESQSEQLKSRLGDK